MAGIFDWLTGSTATTDASTDNASTTIATKDDQQLTATAGVENTKNNTQTAQNTNVQAIGSQTSSNQQDTTQNIHQSSTQESTAQQNAVVTGRTLSGDELSTLDKTAALIAGNPDALVGNPTARNASSVAEALLARAGGTPIVFDNLAKKATDAATNLFDTRTRADISNAAARGGGSTNGSFAQLLLNRGQQDLSTQVAQIVANLGVQGEQQQSTELKDALAGLIASGNLGVNEQAGASQSIAQLLGVAKGGETSTESESSTVSKVIQQMVQEAKTSTAGGSKTDTANAQATSSLGAVASEQNSTKLQQQIVELLSNAASHTDANASTTSTTENSGSVLDIFKTLASFTGRRLGG